MTWRAPGFLEPLRTLAAIAVLFLLFAWIAPRTLKPVQKVVMAVALTIGWVMTRVILTLLYYLVLTPIGLFCRLGGKHFLDLSFRDPARDTYWIPRKTQVPTKEQYEVQY